MDAQFYSLLIVTFLFLLLVCMADVHLAMALCLKILIFCFLLPSDLPRAYAQDFSVPSTWLNTNSSLTKGDYAKLSSNATLTLLGSLDKTFQNIAASDAANVVITLSQQDSLNGNTTWLSQTTNALQVYATQSPTYPPGTAYEAYNGDTLFWALAAANAYKSYNDSSFLTIAQALWNVAFTDYISSESIQTGKLPRLFNTTSTCQPNLAGGIFTWHSPVTELDMFGDVIGLFVEFVITC